MAGYVGRLLGVAVAMSPESESGFSDGVGSGLSLGERR